MIKQEKIIRLVHSEREIQFGILSLSREINEYYDVYHKNEIITIVPVMNAAMVFCTHLMKNLRFPYLLKPIQIQRSNEVLTENFDLSEQNKHLLLVDTIFDTGRTFKVLKEKLIDLQRKTFKDNTTTLNDVCLIKRHRAWYESPTPKWVEFEYFGDEFLFGFGLDDENGLNRGISSIFV